jgi:sorbitol-specific phosphotransferase system component IIBC
MKGKSDNCLNSEYVSGYKLQKMTLVQNGSKEAKLKNIKFLLMKGSSSTKFSSQNLNRSSVLLIITFFPIIARSIALLRTPDNCLNSEYVSDYKLQKITVVQNGAENGSKEAKSKEEKKELTQDKKLTAEESSETDIKKDSDVRTCNQNSRQNQEAYIL